VEEKKIEPSGKDYSRGVHKKKAFLEKKKKSRAKASRGKGGREARPLVVSSEIRKESSSKGRKKRRSRRNRVLEGGKR